MKNYDEVV